MLQENFTFLPEEDPENPVKKPMIKAYALKKMAELFRRWKNELKSSFVDQDKTPEFISRFEKIKDQWPEFVTKKKFEKAAKIQRQTRKMLQRRSITIARGQVAT